MPVGVIPCHLHHLASIFLDLSSVFLCIYEVICKRKTRLLTHRLKTPFLLFSACRLVHFFKMTFLFLIFPCSVSPLLFLKFMFFKLYFPWECLLLHPKVSPLASPPTHPLPWISANHCMSSCSETRHLFYQGWMRQSGRRNLPRSRQQSQRQPLLSLLGVSWEGQVVTHMQRATVSPMQAPWWLVQSLWAQVSLSCGFSCSVLNPIFHRIPWVPLN